MLYCAKKLSYKSSVVNHYKSYWRGSGGSRGAVVSRVTETLRVRETGSAAEPTGLAWPTVLHNIAARLIRVRALDNQIIISFYNITYVRLNEGECKCKRYSA